MMRAIGIAIIGSLMASNAMAGDWRLVASDSRGVVTGIDASSIRNASGARMVWAVRVYPPGHDFEGPRYDYVLLHQTLDCSNRTIAVGQTVAYAMSGDVVETSPGQPYQRDSVIPDSVGEAVWEAGCGVNMPASEGLTTALAFAAAYMPWD